MLFLHSLQVCFNALISSKSELMKSKYWFGPLTENIELPSENMELASGFHTLCIPRKCDIYRFELCESLISIPGQGRSFQFVHAKWTHNLMDDLNFWMSVLISEGSTANNPFGKTIVWCFMSNLKFIFIMCRILILIAIYIHFMTVFP